MIQLVTNMITDSSAVNKIGKMVYVVQTWAMGFGKESASMQAF